MAFIISWKRIPAKATANQNIQTVPIITSVLVLVITGNGSGLISIQWMLQQLGRGILKQATVCDTVKNNTKEFESKNVGVRFIKPVKETGRIPARQQTGIRPLQELGGSKQKVNNYFKNYRL